jgi:DNA helicase II / ATP-dependent DNA helicase PcrA
MNDLLKTLNPPQLEAVTLPSSSALVLAGAGSGKTKVLTTRIAWRIQTAQASPMNILAVTFTNKAAKEMLHRLSAMLPINTRGMWVGTFHGLCNRFLRTHYREANLPQVFQILDTQDQLSLIKRLFKANNVDDEKFPPKQFQWFIASAKEEGLRANAVEAFDDFSKKQVEYYALYEQACQREGVVDFAELLLRTYEVLLRNQPLREHYQMRFTDILVDEFQDTNSLQYKWLRQIAGPNASVFAVGDDDQCFVAGTRVTLANGKTRAIEKVVAGDEVMSSYGTGDMRAARVVRTHAKEKTTALIEIRTASGAKLTSTPEHTHFAGYLLGFAPQVFFSYLMYKKEVGFRVGTSCVYTAGQKKPMVGFKQRGVQEHADAIWIIGTHKTEIDARRHEMIISLRYGLPTLPFVPRKGKAVNGLVHDKNEIAKVFSALDTHSAGNTLLRDVALDFDAPHHRARSRNSSRMQVIVSLCADRRGRTPMHRVTIVGNQTNAKSILKRLGFSVRPAKLASRSWRFETVRADYLEVMGIAEQIAQALQVPIVQTARIGALTLPFIRAAHVREGMVMMRADGTPDYVTAVKTIPEAKKISTYDLDVAHTHNYVANGIVTHNSIYAFRGAKVGNMQSFERDYAPVKLVKLEQNYRSYGNILDAANALIDNNNGRLGKNLWTDAGKGEKIRGFLAYSDAEEAAFIVDCAKQAVNEGVIASEIAILYRSNAQSRVLEHALFNARMPYKVYGGLRFFERAEIKNALAYLRLIANQDDDGALLRVINFPPRGIGARTLETLQETAQMAGVTLWQAACGGAGGAGRARESVGGFVRLVESMRAATKGLPLPEVMDHMIEASGLLTHYATEKDGQDRADNLKELVTAADNFMREAGGLISTMENDGTISGDPLIDFLTHAALEAGDTQAAEGKPAVQMMTVHAAKGLEFDQVFITGLEEGLFPHDNSIKDDNGVEEERRLMYVAITRARKKLTITHTQMRMMHGQTRYNIASRFLEEIPEALLQWLSPKPRAFASADYETSGYGAKSPAPAYAAAAPAAQKSSGTDSGFRIGQNVLHAKFGAGVIVNAEGRGGDARVQVNFRDAGMKLLDLKFAKLTVV